MAIGSLIAASRSGRALAAAAISQVRPSFPPSREFLKAPHEGNMAPIYKIFELI
jgi:hypothetical protein